MPVKRCPYISAPFVVTILLLLSACGTTPPSSFYLLAPVTGKDTLTSDTTHNDVHIGVGPVQFAEYLDRTQIVTRTSAAQVHLAETHRWAEPLQNNFARTLAHNLSIMLNTNKVSLYPSRNWPDIDYQVVVDVWQLDASKQGEVTLVANWSLRTDKGAELSSMKKSVFHAEIEPAASYADIAAAISSTVAMLSREIAETIREKQE